MTDTYEPDDDNSTEEPNPRDLRAQLAQRAKEADELREELAATKWQAELRRALGDNADAPWARYFAAGYEGDVDAEAIRKAAAEAGFLPDQPQQQAQPAEDLSAHGRMAANAQGGSGAAQMSWQEALAEADRVSTEAEREAAILGVVERYGGTTSRTAQ